MTDKPDPALGLRLMAKTNRDSAVEMLEQQLRSFIEGRMACLTTPEQKLALIARLREQIDKLESKLAKKRKS